MSVVAQLRRSNAGTQEERLRTLHAAGLLDTLPEDNFDELVAIAAEHMKAPMALFSLVAGDRIWFKARFGTDAEEVELECAFCAYATRHDAILVVEDATKDPRFSQNRLVLSGPCVRFYVGIPVHASNGHVLGTLCVMDTKARTISEQELGTLESLARSIETQLELRQLLIDQNRVAEERAILTHMIVHDVNGIVAALKLSFEIADRSLQENSATFAHCRLAAEELHDLCANVLAANAIEPRRLAVEIRPQSLKSWLDSLGLRMRRAAQDMTIFLETENEFTDEPIETDIGMLERIAMNLINNAIQACSPGSLIRIRGRFGDDSSLELEVSDNGPGVPVEIVDRIFEPYVSFRHSGDRGTGLGLTICRLSARALGGSIQYQPCNPGARFMLTVPVQADNWTRGQRPGSGPLLADRRH